MYYIIYGFLYALSLLPWCVLYIISDGIYLLMYYIIGYRKDVVMDNLTIAFPEKTAAERTAIMKDFYKGFIDNFIETIKLFSISGEELNKRFVGNFEVVNDLYATGKKVQLHSGHFFNWEFANLGYSHNFKYPLLTVYMPISNKALDKIFINMRKKFGANLIAATEFATKFAGYNKQQYCLALVGDQNPGSPENAYWTTFFGKMTPIVKGPERGARVANTAIVMCNFYKVKRGYYKTDLVLLTTEPRSLPQGEITKQMISFVEDSIRKHPSGYLWSHRRWKWEFDAEKYKKMVI
ncbi:MAG TPA: lipid A biosynthesis acyltransferase [Panacibacter sp.]|nr:lipid A biosynthesis acyltransferase [Panacibacter sp.]